MLNKNQFPFGEDTGIHTIYADFSKPQHPNYYPDIVYANHSGMDLHIQLLTMAQPGDRYPCLVYVQGSGWAKQLTQLYIPKMVDFAYSGFVVACVEYRPSEVEKFPAQIQDVRAAIRYLRANADQYGIDPDCIGLMGDSSGAHTSLMAVLGDGSIEDTPDYPNISSKVNCIVDIYGPTDMLASGLDARWENMPEERKKNFVFRADTKEEMYELLRRGNPLAYVTPEADIPPMLILHGDADVLVPFNQSVILYEKMRECGKTVEFYKILGAGHGVGFWIPPVYDAIKAFLRAYIYGKKV